MPAILTVLLLWLMPAMALGSECKVDPGWRKRAPDAPPHLGAYRSLLSPDNALEETPLGIGHIHAGLERSLSPWLDKITLPLSSEPDAPPMMVLVNGWLIDSMGAEPLPNGGLIETDYEQSSILVLEKRDGWYRIRIRPPGQTADTAWTPACALPNSEPPLQYASWDEWLMSDHISPLFYRRKSVHNLRAGPGTRFAIRGKIRPDHILRPRSIQGDWMEVMVSQPSDYCARATVERSMGWIRWRSPGRGPWLWYYTRGC